MGLAKGNHTTAARDTAGRDNRETVALGEASTAIALHVEHPHRPFFVQCRL